MPIPFQDFHSPYEELREELDEAYRRFMRSGWYVLGPEADAFENEYASFCEAKHCVGVGNGLDALHLALKACSVGPGDEVIVPANTYIATWLAVSQVGATPVPVEPLAETFNLDPARIARAITAKTKAIMPVNLYGQACDYDPIIELARERGLKVVNDNAQAQGARYRGRRVGGLVDVECHSFYPSKNLGAFGEAGAITTNDPAIADRVRVLRNYGSRVRYHNEVPGYNCRIDALQAAFLRVKLRKLDDWNARRRKVAGYYLQNLAGCRGLTLPSVPAWAEPVWHLFVIRCDRRDALQKALTEQGIQTIIHYPIPPHLSGAYRSMGLSNGAFPVSEKLAGEILSIPIGPHISEQDQASLVSAIKHFCEKT